MRASNRQKLAQIMKGQQNYSQNLQVHTEGAEPSQFLENTAFRPLLDQRTSNRSQNNRPLSKSYHQRSNIAGAGPQAATNNLNNSKLQHGNTQQLRGAYLLGNNTGLIVNGVEHSDRLTTLQSIEAAKMDEMMSIDSHKIRAKVMRSSHQRYQ